MANERSDVFKHYNMNVGPDECWVWSGSVGGRKRDLRPYYQADGKRTLAYRTVFELVNGVSLSPTQLICHSCDNGAMPIGCGNPAHLSIGTVQDNSDDMTERQRHGLPHHVVKTIAELYGISRENVSAIKNGRTYKNV